MIPCLLVSRDAAEFAKVLSRHSDLPIALTVCQSASSAVEEYGGQAVVLGDPDAVAAALPDMAEVRWVQSTWAGIKPLLRVARRDYVLTGVKNVFGPQMAEYVFACLLAHELRLAARYEAQLERRWWPQRSGTLAGKRMGILGTGSIGRYVAKTAQVLGLRVSGLSLSGRPQDGFERVYAADKLHELLADCDYLVSVLPDTRATTGLLDKAALGTLPAHAYFINVGRGNVVDDAALVAALESGRIAGASLDVFDEEPLPSHSPLWSAPNLRVTAHVAADSHAELIVPLFVDNLQRYLRGEPLQHVVDFATGY